MNKQRRDAISKIATMIEAASREQTLSAVFKAQPYAGGNPTDLEKLVWTFKAIRANGTGATKALRSARDMWARGSFKFPSSDRKRVSYGRPFDRNSDLRWIEHADTALRFVDYADKLARIDHTGWYLDEFQDEQARGVVYRLPNGRGLLPGYETTNDEKGNVVLEFSPFDSDDEIGAAHRADQLAEQIAEQEREYREAADAGMRYVDYGEEIDASKATLRKLKRELAVARKHFTAHGRETICEVIRDKMTALRGIIADLGIRRVNLLHKWGDTAGFRDAVGD